MLWHTFAESGTALWTDENNAFWILGAHFDTAKMVRLLANGRVFCLCKKLFHASK